MQEVEFTKHQAVFGCNNNNKSVQVPKVLNYPFKFSPKASQMFPVKLLCVTAFRFCIILYGTVLLLLRADPLVVIKEASQGVNLSYSNDEHDKHV